MDRRSGAVLLRGGRVRFAVIVLAAALAGCATTPTPTPVTPSPPGTPTCETACDHLAQLGCTAAQPTPAGATCLEVCTNIEDSGVIVYGVKCVTDAESCAKADNCGGPAK